MLERLGYRKLVLLTLWVIATALNLTKAFHIDDPFHVLVAQWIAEEPWRPLSGTVNWSGVVEPFHQGNHPPLFFYGMAAWGLVFGFGEVAMHTFLSLFTGLAIYFMHRLSLICCRSVALWTTAFFALSPGFLVNQNVMLDVPVLALILGMLYQGCEAVRQQRVDRAVWSALFMCAAIGVKYTALAVFPAMVLVVWYMEKRPWWIIGIPLLFFMLWSVWNLWEFGYVHLVARDVAPAVGDGWLLRLGSWVMTLGSICPWALVLAVQVSSLDRSWRSALSVLLITGFVVVIALAYSEALTQETSDMVLLSFFVVSGVLVFVPLFHGGARSSGIMSASGSVRTLVLVCLVCLGGFILLFAPWMATRHLLLIVPMLLLLSAWTLERMPRSVALSTLALNALLGVALSLSDRNVASFFAEQATQLSVQEPGRMWYAGSMGWGWYAARSGMKDLHADPDTVHEHHLIAMPVHGPVPGFPAGMNTREVRLIEQELSCVDGFSTRHWMRFYSAKFPQLPWRVSWVDRERISVHQVLSTKDITAGH